MYQFQSGGARTHLAEALYPATPPQVAVLGLREMKHPHGQCARAVADSRQQCPPAIGYRRLFHATDHQGVLAYPQRAYRGGAGSILVTHGQVKHQVLDGIDVQARQPGGDVFTDPWAHCYRDGRGVIARGRSRLRRGAL